MSARYCQLALIMIIGLMLAGCSRSIAFTNYQEHGQWRTWENERLRIRIPANWSINLVTQFENKPVAKSSIERLFGYDEEKQTWIYQLIDDKQRGAFQVKIVDGGDEFITCLCASKDDYQYSRKDNVKIWSLTFKKQRTIKMANQRYRLDIHILDRGVDNKMLDYIAESARPTQ
jgi:hypothetical protein